MKTVQEILKLSTEYLTQKNIDHPRRQAELLIADALQMRRMDLYMQFDRPLDDREVAAVREYLQRRGEGEPLQYIRGQIEFFGCLIKVTRDVLIPRPETEVLVDKIVSELRKKNISGMKLWDICCGSGCIGIAIKKALPEIEVTASDISEKSLEIARENADRNNIEMTFLHGDLFTPYEGAKANFIVCNPPYISDAEFQSLSPEVRDYEPQAALVGGASGLEFYQKIACFLKQYLTPSAKAWLEIGHKQGLEIAQIFSEAGWAHYTVEKDWAGHDRFFSLENE